MRDGRLQGRALWVVLAALAALPAAGCVSLSLLPGAPGALEESVVHGDRGPKILLIHVDGVIRESSPQPRSAFSRRDESSVARLREELDRARDDPEVRALLLRINSPGGSATASDIMYSQILRFKAERDIPVVAQLMILRSGASLAIASPGKKPWSIANSPNECCPDAVIGDIKADTTTTANVPSRRMMRPLREKLQSDRRPSV